MENQDLAMFSCDYTFGRKVHVSFRIDFIEENYVIQRVLHHFSFKPGMMRDTCRSQVEQNLLLFKIYNFFL